VSLLHPPFFSFFFFSFLELTDAYDRTGWLTKDRKKGDDDKRTSKWERRYFVLRSTSAQYFEDPECKKLKGDIPLPW